jgi:tetratricopeptide (TPR) repeat protein
MIPIRGLTPGEVAARRGDYVIYEEQLDAAQTALEEALRLEPNLAAAQESMGLLLLRRKQPEKALPWVEKALASDPASSRGHLLRAQALAEASESAAKAEEVEAEFRKAIELDPRLAAAHHGLAEYYLNSNARGKNILAVASQAAALEPANAKHQMTLARLFLRLRRADLAEAAAQLAVVTSRRDEERSAAEALREEALRSPGSQAAGSSSGEGSNSEEKPALKRREGPERATARGRVVEVRCEGFQLEVELETAEGKVRLHAGNYVQVEVFAVKSGERGSFRVCQDLRGVEVIVWYRAVEGKGYAGEIESIEVKK